MRARKAIVEHNSRTEVERVEPWCLEMGEPLDGGDVVPIFRLLDGGAHAVDRARDQADDEQQADIAAVDRDTDARIPTAPGHCRMGRRETTQYCDGGRGRQMNR